MKFSVPSTIQTWLESLQTKVLHRFSDRVLFIGLQGSYQREEATVSSDIDIVLVLDKVSIKDLATYRNIIETMPFSEKACGFICGKDELARWPKYDLFQLYHDTKPLYKEMKPLLPPINHTDIQEAIQIGAANLYHAASHSFIYSNNKTEALIGLLKDSFFILQAKFFIEHGYYLKNRAELTNKLNGLDSQISTLSTNRKHLINHSSEEIEHYYSILIDWCQNIIRKHTGL